MLCCGSITTILCNQENFTLKGNLYKIYNALPGYHVIPNPAVTPTSERGRPVNGMFVAVPENFKSKFKDVSPGFWRLQAVTFESNNVKILLINSYFPVDTQNNRYDETELVETLQFVKKILQENQYQHVLWAGDLNADFIRKSLHTRILKTFIEEINFKIAWDVFQADFTHYSEINGVSHTSIIDHFLWNSDLENNISDCGVIHHPSNLSDH